MADFVHIYPYMVGDFSFGPSLHAMAVCPSPRYLMPSSSYACTTPSPMTQDPMTYETLPNQIADASFFEEAICASPVSTDMGFGLIQAPSQFTNPPKVPENHGLPQGMLATVEADRKSAHQVRKRSRSQASIRIPEASNSIITAESPKQCDRKPKAELKKKVKARRRRKLGDEDLLKDSRHGRILERNRVVATRCRSRKRDEALALSSREHAMEDQNRYLSSCFDSLTAEIYHLKTQLLRHTDCNCVLIQKYIAIEATKSTDSLLSCTWAFRRDIDSISPYQQITSNSDISPTTSLSVMTPELEDVQPTWTNAFQQSSTLDAGDGMFQMPIESFHERSMSMRSD
jgi:hypothetical protein